jgi:hypothetical protein
MQPRAFLLLAISLLGFAACSGGSSAPGSKAQNCQAGTFCLVSCSLGCSATGCSLTEIAQNQPLRFVFNQPVDPGSVNGATFSLQTLTGGQPSGTLVVNDRSVEFLPDIRLVGGLTVFGFNKGDTYLLTLPGVRESGQTIRSTAGDGLATQVTCTLNVSRGPIDLDGQPPVATLESPQDGAINVPSDVTIVVRFSELIDPVPFQGATSATAPINYRIRRTRIKQGSNPPVRECDPSSTAVILEGFPRISVDPVARQSIVTLKPTLTIPSEVCVEVDVTNRVRDLAGTPGVPKLFTFLTAATTQTERSIVETFQTDAQFDRVMSSGRWGGGEAVPGQIGGDGRHGEFDYNDGVDLGGGVYRWSTDSQLIRNPLFGNQVTVTDGTFYFTTFRLPAGITMKIAGSRPIRIFVRGKAEILGTIDMTAPATAGHDRGSVTGQPGGPGGPGGSTGGRGAHKPTGTGPGFDGQPGEDVALLAGHSYENRKPNTGGRGAKMEPPSGLNQDVTYLGLGGNASAQIAAGGGGGGLLTAGQVGRAVFNNTNPPRGLGPDAEGGIAFDLFPIPTPTHGLFHLEHFLVGGSGGGGGGGHPFFSLLSAPVTWNSGAGGAGGGGAAALRAGGDLQMVSGSTIVSKGGTTAGSPAPGASPGGAGSGGSVVLQIGGQATMGGLVSVLGGTGGEINDRTVFQVETRGGNGAGGFIRFELPGTTPPPITALGTTEPPAADNNVGILVDKDSLAGAQSRWYATRLVFPPDFLRYEVEAIVDNNPIKYSDDARIGPLADVGQAVRFHVQGARVNATTGLPDPLTIKPWRKHVGDYDALRLNGDDATGFRFMLTFDRTVGTNIVVKKVSVFYRG